MSIRQWAMSNEQQADDLLNLSEEVGKLLSHMINHPEKYK
jgi:hypothetical protein